MTYRLPLLVFAALAASVPASAAERNFTVTGFDRIRIDGPYRVRLTTGVAPFAKASGSAAALNGVSIEVQGQTLIVRKNPSGWGSYPGEGPGPIEIAIGTHELSTAWLNGAGSLAIDKAKGQSFDLSVQGAGSIAGSGNVRGQATGTADVSIMGSGDVTLTGGAKCSINKMGSGSANCS